MRALVTLTLGLLFAGCATEYDDRAFFNTGWVKPEEGANRRMYGERDKVPTEPPAPPVTR